MLTNAVDILDEAVKGSYAVGQFNLNGFEWIKAILQLAEAAQTPVILGVNEKAAEYMCGYKTVAEIVYSVDKALGISVPVVLHADHSGFDACVNAIEAGFTSVMYDGSHESAEVNLRNTSRIVRIADNFNVSVEAEAGNAAGEEDGISADGELASVGMCCDLLDCGINILAAGIGNIHGAYPADWSGLNFDRLYEIKSAAGDIPLALHGGSGIPKAMILRAINQGIAKINVNTECKDSFVQSVRNSLRDNVSSPFAIYNAGIEGIKKTTEEKMILFGCFGKAFHS